MFNECNLCNILKNIEGDYDLIIRNNTIILINNNTGATVESKYCSNDTLDFETKMKKVFYDMKKENFKQNNIIEKGDNVIITQPKYAYTHIPTLFYKDNLIKYGSRYRYGVFPSKNLKGKVVDIIKNGKISIPEFYIIEVHDDETINSKQYNPFLLNCSDSVYVMNVCGIEKVREL